MADKLSLAILLDNKEIYKWQYLTIEKLINSEYAHIKLFILKEEKSAKVILSGSNLFYRLHEKIDKLIFGRKIDFDKKVDILKIYNGIKVIDFSNIYSDENLFNIAKNDLHDSKVDILLNLGNCSISSDLLDEFRFGALTYNISQQINQNNAPSCYWEVVKRMAEIEVSIQLARVDLLEKDTIYCNGIFPYPNSIIINRDNLFKLAPILIPRIIEGIYNGGYTYLEEMIRKNKSNVKLPVNSYLQYPTSLQVFSNLVLLCFNFLKRKIKIGRWLLLFKINNKNEIFPSDPDSFTKMKAPNNKFWADPFVIKKASFYYIFIEEYLDKKKKAHISVLKLNDKGELLSNEVIIEKPYHMSYPHIFMHGDSYYMVPETGSNSTIELYTCTEFPNKWVFVKNIMENISAKDSTFFFYNNMWWLFTSIIEMESADISFNELFLFYSDDLFSSNWTSHPKNPIVSDLKLSRPAGKIFMNENKIFRPSQDCSGIYGRALNINCITKLSETEYEEVLVSKTEPDWDKKIIGVHTYNFDDNITLMDAFSY